jgi:4-amino-4-deoxy-L-arabinose transferase-like glycosyltransferase
LKGAFVKTRFVAASNKTAARLAWLIGLTAIAVRLIAITQPFIDNWSWRESDVAAIARNFSENGFRFAYPQIDWAGDAAGYVGTEFPLLPFAVALMYKFAGVHEWIGRFETVLFFAASLPIFYLLIRRIFNESIALWALVFYSFAPLSVVASRAFIPDLPSLCLLLAGIYFFLRWLADDDRQSWLVASIALSLAILIKGTSAIVGLPLLYLSWQRFGTSLVRQKRLWILASIALLPAAIWYWHARQIAAHDYPYHFFGAGGFEIMNLKWYAGIFWGVVTRSLTPMLSLLAFAGAFIPPREKYARIFHWWLGAMVAFVFFLGYGNRHPWYQLPLVPIAAVFAGIFCHQMSERIQRLVVREIVAVVVVLLFGYVSFLYARTFYRPASFDLYEVALRVHQVTPNDARIVAADGGDPTLFYYAHRKGWHFLEKNGIWNNLPLDSAEAISNLEDLRNRGATYLVFPFRTRWWLDYYNEFAAHLKQNAEPIDVTPRFAIYKLNRGRR